MAYSMPIHLCVIWMVLLVMVRSLVSAYGNCSFQNVCNENKHIVLSGRREGGLKKHYNYRTRLHCFLCRGYAPVSLCTANCSYPGDLRSSTPSSTNRATSSSSREWPSRWERERISLFCSEALAHPPPTEHTFGKVPWFRLAGVFCGDLDCFVVSSRVENLWSWGSQLVPCRQSI